MMICDLSFPNLYLYLYLSLFTIPFLYFLFFIVHSFKVSVAQTLVDRELSQCHPKSSLKQLYQPPSQQNEYLPINSEINDRRRKEERKEGRQAGRKDKEKRIKMRENK